MNHKTAESGGNRDGFKALANRDGTKQLERRRDGAHRPWTVTPTGTATLVVAVEPPRRQMVVHRP